MIRFRCCTYQDTIGRQNPPSAAEDRDRLVDRERLSFPDTTSLVHESYLRFVGAGDLRAEDRRAFADPRLAQVAQMRYSGGYSEQEIAEVLGVTVRIDSIPGRRVHLDTR